MRINITGPQHAVLTPLVTGPELGPLVELRKSFLSVVRDEDAPVVVDQLTRDHAAHTGNVGERRALAIVIRKLSEAIPGADSDADASDETDQGENTPRPPVDAPSLSVVPDAAPGDVPDRLSAVLRAIEAGNYGAGAKATVRQIERREGERPTRWLARVRHAQYLAGHDRAGDALATIGGA